MKSLIGGLMFVGMIASPYVTLKLAANKRDIAVAPVSVNEIFLGEFKVTAYRSVRAATDNSPYWSSIGIHTNPWMVAVSQDFLKDGRLQYNDVIFIEGIGFKVVGDAMNKRFTNRFDVWVETYKEEQQFHREFGKKKLKVYLIRRGEQA